jgi:hypothetical protein
MTYDSRPATSFTASVLVSSLSQFSRSCTTTPRATTEARPNSPEVQVFDEFTPKLKTSTYGRTSTRAISKRWAMGLKHHYAYNRHHQEFFGEDGVDGMTLVDLIEMLPDWKAATERHDDGDLAKSLEIHRQSRAGR